MMEAPAPFLVFLRPGPSWQPEMLEIRLARLFGERYDGEVWSAGDPLERDEPGELRVIFRRYSGAKVWSRLRTWFGSVLRGVAVARRTPGPTVLICYDPFTTGTAGLLLKWLTGSRLIVEVNGIYGLADTFVESEGSVFTALKRRVMGFVGGVVLRNADAVKLLFPGQLVGLPVDEDALPVEIFFDSVDSDRFLTHEGPGQEDVILFVGYPFLLKGIDLLLEAFGRLKPEFPTWKLVLVGFDLEGGAQRAGCRVPEDTLFTGPLKPEVVADWMHRCRIFVLPSRSEAMGRVLLEAGLMGRARLVARVGGMPHVVREDVDGLVFEVEDVDSLTCQLRRLMSDAGLRRRLEEEACRRSERLYTQEAYLERYSELIAQVVGV